MATNTPHPVRSARRCVVRSAVSKFFFATAVAIATCSALAFSGALPAGPEIAQATGPSSAQAASGQGYGYPIKPFDREHLIRANLGDPRMQFHGPPTMDTLLHGSGTFSFHQGVDIACNPGTPVYPVADGTVTFVSHEWIRVSSGGGRAFEYWHIHVLVRNGQQVTARKTLLGRVAAPSNHVHLTEYEGGHVVNPLVPGRLTPYHDSTKPTVGEITLRRTDSGPELFPNFVRGSVELVASAEDEPTTQVHGVWYGPATPAVLTWRIRSLRTRRVVARRVAFDFRNSVPPDSSFWRVYARGTYQNQTIFGNHYSYLQRGNYLFKLGQLDTRSLRDGVYDLTVTATDVRGNRGSQTLRFTIHNRRGWR
jgi:peptidase M23-like protein